MLPYFREMITLANGCFGSKLREIRESNHLTQRQLAYFVGVSDKVVSKWERGASLPKADMITRLANALSVPSDLLLSSKNADVSYKLSDGSPLQTDPEAPPETHKLKPYIPECEGINGGYMCTWSIQSAVAEKHCITGNLCSEKRDALTADFLFGEDSLYHPVAREYRKDLIFMIDDGWDVPFGTENSKESRKLFGSFIPDEEKFRGFGSTPEKRLSNIVKCVEKAGYGGTGLWVAVQKAYSSDEEDTKESARLYWRERVKWSAAAGIKYWKVDWGRNAGNLEYRKMMTEEAESFAPGLLIEHCVCLRPLSSPKQFTKEILDKKKELLSFSRYFRLYDAVDPFYNCVILRRFHEAEMLHSKNHLKNNCILNVESRPIIAAVLGGTYGIMQCTPETEAAIKWQRFAPPFGLGTAKYRFSKETLTDNYYFANDLRSWVKCADEWVKDSPCPAVMSRGCELPKVNGCDKYLPYVIASCNPISGAYSVAALRRTEDPYFNAAFLADITVRVKDTVPFVGVFGVMNSLTLEFPKPPKFSRVIAQNLFSDETSDITEKVVFEGSRLMIDGKLLRFCGKTASLNDDRDYGPMLFLRFIK